MLPKRLVALTLFAALAVMHTGALRAQWVQTNGSPNVDPAQCFFASGSDLFAGTRQNLFLRSTDNGANWWVVDTVPILDYATPGVADIEGNDTNLFASCYVGLFRSTDTGNHWTEIDSGLLFPKDGLDLLNPPLAIVGSNLFVGTARHGVFRSTDNGKSWFAANKGMLNGDQVWCFAVSETTLFSGVGGVFVSSNFGTSWDSLDNGLTNNWITVLAISDTNIFAGTGGGGIFRSTDTGKNWIAVNAGLPTKNNIVNNIVVSGKYLFANDSTVFLSTDDGESWKAINEGLPGTYIYGLAVIGSNLYAGTTRGIWRRSISDFAAVTSNTVLSNSLSSYPNPLSQFTTISFSPEVSGYADVSIVNPLGVEIAHLFSGVVGAGNHSFTWNPTGVPDGMYECLVRMNGRVETLPMLLQH